MTFEELLDQAIALLQRRGRLTYRALKRQFNLDDDYLEDLKAELIQGQRLTVDEDGEVLVWIGETDVSLTTTPRDAQSTPPGPPLPPEAERRQLTVMFCDLAGSTALSGQLDPEDLREVIRAYQQTSATVIQRFGGSIAQYLGDGLLVYFGYPQAHEDDPQRAVRAGLGILEATERLNTHLAQQYQVRVAVRVGIHTGLVVVGEMGGGGRQEYLALGETPNIAARLEALAPPNRVVISRRTQQLVGGAFDLDDLGLHTLKGVAEPMPVYGVRGESAAESRFAAATATGLTPLVGRETELRLLLTRWEQAQAGAGQVVLLTGEAGIGKSRLMETFRERVAAEPHLRLHYQCSPYATHSAFAPIIAQLERAARFTRDDPPAQKLAKLEALLAQATAQVTEIAPLFAALVSIPTGDRYPPLHLSPQRQKAKTVEALVGQLHGLARHHPVLFLWEDAHWSDPTSVEVLDQVVHRVPDQRVLVVITARPEFVAPWPAAGHVTAVTLTRLPRTHVVAMVEQLTHGKALPPAVLDQILTKTDGIPLFVEELTKMILESGLLHEAAERYELPGPLPPLAIPTTLQDSLMARLDRLAPVKEVAQIGAALGREFPYELLAAVVPLRPPALVAALDQLVVAELLVQHGQPPAARYHFKHALVQEAAYTSLLRSRRQQLHAGIAQVLEAHFPETAATQPEVLAQHYTAAGLPAPAVDYWLQAGERARQRSANADALSHLTTGLSLLETLPVGPERTHRELALRIALGNVLIATKGYAAPEVEQAYARALELCHQVGDIPQRFPILYGVFAFQVMRGDYTAARALGEEFLHLAHQQQDPALLLEAHRILGTTLCGLGEFALTQAHAEQGVALYKPQHHRAHALVYGQDPGVTCHIYAAVAVALQGYLDQAVQRMHEAQRLARELAHPFSLALALAWAATLHQFRGEVQSTQALVTEAITLATEQGFPLWVVVGTILHGWVGVTQGQGAAGIAQMRQGVMAYRATGVAYGLPWYLALLAEAEGRVGQPEAGLATLADALGLVAKNGGRAWDAELHRLKGTLLLRHAPTDADYAEVCLHHALTIARRQQAKSFELRAAMSLGRLWQQQGKQAEAHALLAPIYGWFTEGFDTADLQEAKALLDTLA